MRPFHLPHAAARFRAFPGLLVVLAGGWLAVGAGAAEERRLLAGGDFSYPPYEYLDIDGKARGFNVDLLRAIARDRGLAVEVMPGPWEQRREQLENGEIDILPMFISGFRDRRVDFTQPFLVVNHEIFVRKNDLAPARLEHLAGRQVIVEKDSYAHDFLELNDMPAELLPVDSERAAMQLLASGGGDAAILGELRGRLMLDERWAGNVTTSGPPVMPVAYAFAVPEGDAALLAELNAGLASVKASGEFNRIYARWLARDARTWEPLFRYLAWIAGIGILAALLVVAWVVSLRRQVRQRTSALVATEQRFRATFEHAAVGMAWLAPDCRWMSVNAALCRMMATDGDALKRIPLRRILPGDALRECIRKVRELRFATHGSFALELPFRRADGQPGWARLAVSLLRDTTDGKPRGFIAVAEDVTEARRVSDQLSWYRTHDTLTGLLNRHEFENRLHAVLASGGEEAQHVLCYLDIDQFRLINNTSGEAAGDEFLRHIGAQLSSLKHKGDLLGRLGADQFAILLARCSLQRGMEIADALRESIGGQEFDWNGQRFKLTVSIGIVPVTAGAEFFGGVLSAANTACHVAKEQGGNRVHAFTEDDRDVALRQGEVRWVAKLKAALEEDRFELHCQRIEPLQQSDPRRHYEVLLRLRDAQGRLVMPGRFLPAAERYFLAEALDRWVVDHALAWLAAHPDEIERLGMCAINLSGQSVGNPEFHRFLEGLLDRHDLPPGKLCFEITESAAIGDIERAAEFARKLKQRGCFFALDDFGIGMSSFAYLKRLPVDFLKIDGMFVRDIASDPLDKAIVRSIATVGHALGKRTIAEYVESEEILAIVRELGIDFAQGYAISRPRLLADPAEQGVGDEEVV